jgi:hypothetical protein
MTHDGGILLALAVPIYPVRVSVQSQIGQPLPQACPPAADPARTRNWHKVHDLAAAPPRVPPPARRSRAGFQDEIVPSARLGDAIVDDVRKGRWLLPKRHPAIRGQAAFGYRW